MPIQVREIRGDLRAACEVDETCKAVGMSDCATIRRPGDTEGMESMFTDGVGPCIVLCAQLTVPDRSGEVALALYHWNTEEKLPEGQSIRESPSVEANEAIKRLFADLVAEYETVGEDFEVHNTLSKTTQISCDLFFIGGEEAQRDTEGDTALRGTQVFQEALLGCNYAQLLIEALEEAEGFVGQASTIPIEMSRQAPLFNLVSGDMDLTVKFDLQGIRLL